VRERYFDCGNLRVKEDNSKEENSGNEVGNWVQGSRIRKPVPAGVEDLGLEVQGKLKKVLLV